MAKNKAARFRPPYLQLEPPRKVGETNGWEGAFARAQELVHEGPLRLIAISMPGKHCRLGDERCMELTDKGTPEQTLAWMNEFTPLVHESARRVELYVSEGQMMHLCGPYDVWRLDMVFSP